MREIGDLTNMTEPLTIETKGKCEMLNLKTSVAVIAMILTTTTAYSQEVNIYDIEIKPQGLTEALARLSDLTQMQLIYSPEQLDGIKTAGASGRLTSLMVLEKLLANTSLILDQIDETTYVIKYETDVRGKLQNISYGENYLDNLAVLENDERADRSETTILDEIIVTASKRGGVVAQNLATSITAFGKNQLDRLDALDFEDFIVQVPGTNFISNGGAGRGNEVASIRGLSPVADNTLSVVAQYLDGAPRFGENFRLFDIAEVSVLRGPQGTLWGAQSIGGLISYQSARPNHDGFEAEVQADLYTSKNDGGISQRYGGHINIPLIADKLSVRFAGHYIDETGYIDNVTKNVEDINSTEEYAWRASLLFTPSESLEFLVIYHGNDLSSNAPSFFDLDAGELTDTSNFSSSPANQKYNLVNFIVEADLGWASLSYNGAYFDQSRLVVDFDANVFGFIPYGRADSIDEQSSWTHEIRLASTGSSSLQWIFGLYYDDLETNDPSTQIQVDEAGMPTSSPAYELFVIGGREDRREVALFGEVEYEFNEKLSVLLGGRYFDWKVDNQEEFTYFGSNYQQETGVVSGDNFFYKVQLNYRPTEDMLLYALRSEGFRFGGFNPFVGPALGIPAEFVRFDPDKLANYEAGVKSSWLEGKLTVNAAAYFMDWMNIQTVVFNEAGNFSFTTNGPALNAWGGEIEIATQDILAPGVYMSATYAYNKNKFQEDARVFPGVRALIEEGDELRRTPRHTWSLNVGYEFTVADDFEAFIRGNYWHKAATTTEGFNSGDGAVAIAAQNIVNLSTGFWRDSWQVKLYLDNIFNSKPLLQVFPAASSGGPGGDVATRASTLRPRTLGLEITKTF